MLCFFFAGQELELHHPGRTPPSFPQFSPTMRKLKHHEEKLLRKVCVSRPAVRILAAEACAWPSPAPFFLADFPDPPPHPHSPPPRSPLHSDFLSWKKEDNVRELKILRRYHIQRREDYVTYTKLAGHVTKLTAKLKQLPPANAVRVSATQALLDKLFRMGLIDTASSLAKAEALPASAFCRRRLPVVLVRLRMAETLREAVALVEQGQVRVGPEPVTDPAFIVTRTLEDFVTWVDAGRIKRAKDKYNDKLDDYELLGL